MLARRSLSPVRSFAATVVEPRPTGKVFAWARRTVFKRKSSNPKNDDETVVMAVLHDKQEGTFYPLTSKVLIFDLGEREGLYRGCHPLLSGLILPF